MNIDHQDSSLDWVVFKISQRCNLDCTYCYVYNRGDSSWKQRPKLANPDVIKALLLRIDEQIANYNLDKFVVELHGGEPLLMGVKKFHQMMEIFKESKNWSKLKFILQTNGTLLNEEWIKLFSRYDIEFGISLDGPAKIADIKRSFRNGSGSTDKVLSNIDYLRKTTSDFDRLFGGTLAVIDTSTDMSGADYVKWFVSNGFNSFEFLLPDISHNNLGDVHTKDLDEFIETIGKFLVSAFRQWYKMGEDRPEIRMFETMGLGFFGIKPKLDSLGGDINNLCVVESDGSIGISDVLRYTDRKYQTDSINVFEHSLDYRSTHYSLPDLQELSSKCKACKYRYSCGGGYLPHRYDGVSFKNPSIYCSGLYTLLDEICATFKRDSHPKLWKSA